MFSKWWITAKISVSQTCVSTLSHVVWCRLQDEHILARKFADRWMAQALGVGLFKRRLYRKEVEDTRQVLYSTINPLAKVSNEAPVCIPKP